MSNTIEQHTQLLIEKLAELHMFGEPSHGVSAQELFAEYFNRHADQASMSSIKNELSTHQLSSLQQGLLTYVTSGASTYMTRNGL